ncbi:hypothetical protein [Nonomuraea sp. NPDC049695]|uniref:hypothetical protein n=1 Tax=Nonomuraea sp. NPDC049695 TaxID=3154734 RepID=UPI003438269B
MPMTLEEEEIVGRAIVDISPPRIGPGVGVESPSGVAGQRLISSSGLGDAEPSPVRTTC